MTPADTESRFAIESTALSGGWAMLNAVPHYLLFTHTNTDPSGSSASWQFVLQQVERRGQIGRMNPAGHRTGWIEEQPVCLVPSRQTGPTRIEAGDDEPFARGERLQLLAVVRGLEALEQPSRVTLVTGSHFIERGLRIGVSSWRENNWQWERFGEMTEVKNADLWKRIDRARSIHQLQCRLWNFESHLPPRVVSHRVVGSKKRSESPVHPRRPVFPRISWQEIADAVAQRIQGVSAGAACGCA
jgi:hypothetical protein